MKFSLPGREDGEKKRVATLECRIEVSKFVNLNFIVFRGLLFYSFSVKHSAPAKSFKQNPAA